MRVSQELELCLFLLQMLFEIFIDDQLTLSDDVASVSRLCCFTCLFGVPVCVFSVLPVLSGGLG